MPLFMCTRCGCIENTATSEYWAQQMAAYEAETPFEPLCSEHNPAIGRWHNQFPRRSAAGYVTDKRGFIYSREETEDYFKDHGPFKPVVLPASAQEAAAASAPEIPADPASVPAKEPASSA